MINSSLLRLITDEQLNTEYNVHIIYLKHLAKNLPLLDLLLSLFPNAMMQVAIKFSIACIQRTLKQPGTDTPGLKVEPAAREEPSSLPFRAWDISSVRHPKHSLQGVVWPPSDFQIWRVKTLWQFIYKCWPRKCYLTPINCWWGCCIVKKQMVKCMIGLWEFH